MLVANLHTDDRQIEMWAERFLEHREKLLALARRNLNPVLARRVSAEDVVQEALAAACRRIAFFESNPEVPLYFKLRTILLQTLVSLERRHLQAQKRDAYKEMEVTSDDEASPAVLSWNMFADTMTGAFTRLARVDRRALLHQALEELTEGDRRIIELRHFDGLSNNECAEALGITPKNASIRHVRALQKLQQKLMEFTEFKNE